MSVRISLRNCLRKNIYVSYVHCVNLKHSLNFFVDLICVVYCITKFVICNLFKRQLNKICLTNHEK